MKFPHFFIDRPIFAIVMSVLIVVFGIVAYPTLPVAQYPEMAPPQVVVTASFPGATAETVAETVATPLEESINGVENMLYMSSSSTGDGTVTITITFVQGADVNQAQVLVQNRVVDRAAAPATGSATDRRHDKQKLARSSFGRNAGFARWVPAPTLSVQLCHATNFRQAQPPSRRRQCAAVRRSRFQHAHLDRSRPRRRSQSDRR